MEASKAGFATRKINSWTEFADAANKLRPIDNVQWIFRGQAQDWCLKTSLERKLDAWGIPLARGPRVELELRREFRRRYKGNDFTDVRTDKLYCAALMQHHGAPTRLLDCTYSPFVAAQNAIKDGANSDGCPHVVWCFFGGWFERAAIERVGKPLCDARNYDNRRNDKSFDRLYLSTPPREFVLHENPFQLNQRLSLQQGIFLCPGNIQRPFADNLRAMNGHDQEQHIVKLTLE